MKFLRARIFEIQTIERGDFEILHTYVIWKIQAPSKIPDPVGFVPFPRLLTGGHRSSFCVAGVLQILSFSLQNSIEYFYKSYSHRTALGGDGVEILSIFKWNLVIH